MSLFFGWFWSNKKPTEAEQSSGRSLHQELMAELKECFDENGLADWAERRYDYDAVYDKLRDILDRVDESYVGCEYHDGQWTFPSLEAREQCRKVAREYMDALVDHQDFVLDHGNLTLAMARKVHSYATDEGFLFDWHYFQLFRRHLDHDLKQSSVALREIALASGMDPDQDDDEVIWDEE